MAASWTACLALLCMLMTQTVSSMPSPSPSPSPSNPTLNTLKVGILLANSKQRAAYEEVSEGFKKEHPDVDVQFVVNNDAGYKESLEGWLLDEQGLDVLYWQAGERLRHYVRQGLVISIEDLWQEQKWDDTFSNAVKTEVIFQDKAFALPYSYYPWGFYYKKSLFERLNLSVPRNWNDFLRVCEVLKAKNINPIAIGTKNHWPAASWFDYLNLRINGVQFHKRLLDGNIPFMDDRVLSVFEYWQHLIESGFFYSNHSKYEWKEVLPLLYQELSGMMLIGNFAAKEISPAIASDIGFFKFPVINPDMPPYEIAPMEVFMIPANSSQKKLAKQFLSYIARESTQTLLNQRLGYISPHLHSEFVTDPFIQEGVKLLKEAKGLTQYYDRDTPLLMSKAGIKIFAQFLSTADVHLASEQLEQVRLRYLSTVPRIDRLNSVQ